MAVGTYQGVAGLAPRPFTLGEETGSHLRPSPPSPPPSVAAVGRRRRPTPRPFASGPVASQLLPRPRSPARGVITNPPRRRSFFGQTTLRSATTKPSCQHTSREHRQSSTASWPHADLSGGPRMVRARLVSSYQAAEAQESCPSSIMDHIIAAVAGAQTQSLRACAPGSSSTLRPAPLSHSGRWSRPPPCENGAAGRFVRPQGAIQFAYRLFRL